MELKKKQTYVVGDHITYNHHVSRYKPTHEIRTGIIEGYEHTEPGIYFLSWQNTGRNGRFLVRGTNISHFRVDSVSYDGILGLHEPC